MSINVIVTLKNGIKARFNHRPKKRWWQGAGEIEVGYVKGFVLVHTQDGKTTAFPTDTVQMVVETPVET